MLTLLKVRGLFLRFLFNKRKPSCSRGSKSHPLFAFLEGACVLFHSSCVVYCGVRTKNIPKSPPFLLPVPAGYPTPCLRRVEENDQLPAFLMQSLPRLSGHITQTLRITRWNLWQSECKEWISHVHWNNAVGVTGCSVHEVHNYFQTMKITLVASNRRASMLLSCKWVISTLCLELQVMIAAVTHTHNRSLCVVFQAADLSPANISFCWWYMEQHTSYVRFLLMQMFKSVCHHKTPFLPCHTFL